MKWKIEFFKDFDAEFEELNQIVQDELLAHLLMLGEFGPSLGRPHADTLNGSKFSNMKELRFKADNGVWRVAFVFDPNRNGILLVAGNKGGASQKQFYKKLIKKADDRYQHHLNELEVCNE